MFFLRPLKEELFYLNPLIAIYHDVISEGEMNKVKELATPEVSGTFI